MKRMTRPAYVTEARYQANDLEIMIAILGYAQSLVERLEGEQAEVAKMLAHDLERFAAWRFTDNPRRRRKPHFPFGVDKLKEAATVAGVGVILEHRFDDLDVPEETPDRERLRIVKRIGEILFEKQEFVDLYNDAVEQAIEEHKNGKL
jgi:hypothetical protein